MSDADTFHERAKAAGNTLKSYVFAYASGATAVYFLNLSGDQRLNHSWNELVLASGALLFFFTACTICVYELHLDSKLNFEIANQLNKPAEEQNWEAKKKYQEARLRMLFENYRAVGMGTIISVFYVVFRVVP